MARAWVEPPTGELGLGTWGGPAVLATRLRGLGYQVAEQRLIGAGQVRLLLTPPTPAGRRP